MLTAANPNGSNYMKLATSDSSGTTAINFEGSLIYERLFAEDHRVSGMFLYSVRSKSKNRPVNYIDAYPTKNMGIAGRFTYAFRDKYFRRVQLRLQRFRELRPRQALRLLPPRTP